MKLSDLVLNIITSSGRSSYKFSVKFVDSKENNDIDNK